MTSPFGFPYTLRPLGEAEGGGWLAEFPDLPGCIADGATPEEALREAADALASWQATMRELGRPIPEPSRDDPAAYSGKWLMRDPRSLHRRLAQRARAESVSLNALASALLAEGLGYRRGTHGERG